MFVDFNKSSSYKKNQLAETVARVVMREFVARFGCPLRFIQIKGKF